MQTPSVDVPRKSKLRLYFIGSLIVVIVAQVIAMIILMQSQVRTAEERSALDASSRLTAARCFETTTHRKTDSCRASESPRKVTEVVENVLPAATVSNDKEPAGVVPVGFAAAR
jgi:hypothetical protein